MIQQEHEVLAKSILVLAELLVNKGLITKEEMRESLKSMNDANIDIELSRDDGIVYTFEPGWGKRAIHANKNTCEHCGKPIPITDEVYAEAQDENETYSVVQLGGGICNKCLEKQILETVAQGAYF